MDVTGVYDSAGGRIPGLSIEHGRTGRILIRGTHRVQPMRRRHATGDRTRLDVRKGGELCREVLFEYVFYVIHLEGLA